ncbi:MAG: hypothetical protein EB127_00125 [Alphaproteobacteria bacterium]|nr:hypothetical protein [Alphaproteobacteria bacterium]
MAYDEQVFKSAILQQGRMGFSGCDINALIRLPAYFRGDQELNKERVFNIGTLQTISISTYNSKTPIKAIGSKNPIAIARGGRTIAGTMIFNQMHTHVLNENTWPSLNTRTIKDDGFLTYSSGNVDYIVADKKIKEDAHEKVDEYIKKENLKKQWDFSWDNTLIGETSKPSDIPPFDIVIVMVNELGNVGKIVLYGVDIIHDSQTLSVEDIYTEVQYQYIARDIEYFHASNFEESKAWQGSNAKYEKQDAYWDPKDPNRPATQDEIDQAKQKAIKAGLDDLKLKSNPTAEDIQTAVNLLDEMIKNDEKRGKGDFYDLNLGKYPAFPSSEANVRYGVPSYLLW